MRILTEPKNALCKQYHKLLEYDNVALSFESGALDAIAEKAIDRQIGARGLRAIMEGRHDATSCMRSRPTRPFRACSSREDCVRNGSKPGCEQASTPSKPRTPIASGMLECDTLSNIFRKEADASGERGRFIASAFKDAALSPERRRILMSEFETIRSACRCWRCAGFACSRRC